MHSRHRKKLANNEKNKSALSLNQATVNVDELPYQNLNSNQQIYQLLYEAGSYRNQLINSLLSNEQLNISLTNQTCENPQQLIYSTECFQFFVRPKHQIYTSLLELNSCDNSSDIKYQQSLMENISLLCAIPSGGTTSLSLQLGIALVLGLPGIILPLFLILSIRRLNKRQQQVIPDDYVNRPDP